MKTAAFSVVEMLVVLVILAVLVWMAIPQVSCGPVSGVLTGVLSNARQLHMVTQQMTLDNMGTEEGMEWTMWRSGKSTKPISLAEYFYALTNQNAYLMEKELKKLISAPGKNLSTAPLNAENIGFRIFQFDNSAPADQPFVVTANWNDGRITGDIAPGKKGFVVFTKGGGGGIYKAPQAMSTNIFPTGPKYHYETLK
jgi:type II secretory pathway pseudopilin PulG